jgi:cell division protein FtsL
MKKKKKKKMRFQNIIFLLLAAYLIFLLFTQQRTLNQNLNNYNKVTQSINEEEEKNAQLQDELSKVGTDEFIEQEARNELGYVKSNERVYVNSR